MKGNRLNLLTMSILATLFIQDQAAASSLVNGSYFKPTASLVAFDGTDNHLFDLSHLKYAKESSGTIYGAVVWGNSEAYAESQTMDVTVENSAGSVVGLGAEVFTERDSNKNEISHSNGGKLSLSAQSTVNVVASAKTVPLP